LGLRVKVPFTKLDSSDISKPSNSKSSHWSDRTTVV
jgi:hypothetical protein